MVLAFQMGFYHKACCNQLSRSGDSEEQEPLAQDQPPFAVI